MSWIENIVRSRELVRGTGQTELAVIVSGSPADSAFWSSATSRVQRDILCEDDSRLRLVSVTEDHPAGNFLGTIRAWQETVRRIGESPTQGVSLMSMVFGQGKRLSPFTQALGGRKAAFPTPLRGDVSGSWLRTGDMAILYSSLWLNQLASSGFHGVLVKWGDEAILPSVKWTASTSDFRDVDIVRFVWKTVPDEILAKEKEWWVLDEETRRIERLIPRQPYDRLRQALQRYESNRYSTAVNLGSIAVSYRFLEIAKSVLGDLVDTIGPAADWDPFVNLMLLLSEQEDAPSDLLASSEKRCPGLTNKLRAIVSKVRQEMGRPPSVGYLEFGDALWIDLGLHTTLRRTLEALLEESAYGQAMRAFFALPETRDARGNICMSAVLGDQADVRDSVILDSSVQAGSVRSGVIVGSRHQELQMLHGGASLFSAGPLFRFEGSRGVTFRSVTGQELVIPEGGRHTTFFASQPPVSLITNEAVQRYDNSEYGAPILGNSMSFEEAAAIATSVDPWEIEDRWLKAWNS
jgi:hypothetical protein